VNAIGGAVNTALQEAGATEVTFAAACLGFSGDSADKETLTREIVRAERYTITNDGLIAVMGAD
jgi:N-acetylglucosamine kinase-like BadF-type ATPase